jgi:hypothetical protein
MIYGVKILNIVNTNWFVEIFKKQKEGCKQVLFLNLNPFSQANLLF